MRALRARDSNVPLPPRQRSKPENYVPFNSFSQETAAGPKPKPVNRITKNGARVTNIPKKRFELQLSENVDGSGSESDSDEEFPLTQAGDAVADSARPGRSSDGKTLLVTPEACHRDGFNKKEL